MNDFHCDNAWQKQMRDEILAPYFYSKHAAEGRYVFLDKGRLATILQRRYAVDTILQGRKGAAVCIEEKIVRWPGYEYSSFCLETKSCTVPGYESDGWMVYGKADFLFYCFQQEMPVCLNCWLVDFPKLQEWFWPIVGEFKTFRIPTQNRTEGRLVPVDIVREHVPTWRYRVERKGDFE